MPRQAPLSPAPRRHLALPACPTGAHPVDCEYAESYSDDDTEAETAGNRRWRKSYHNKKHYEEYERHEEKKHYPKDDEEENKPPYHKPYRPPQDDDDNSYGNDDFEPKPSCGKPARVEGVTTSYFYDYSPINATQNYASGIIHHVLIKDLVPGAHYFYRVSGDAKSEVYDFKVPAQSFPLKLGMMADPGLTFNTTISLDRLVLDKPDIMAIIGDFVYADQWQTWADRVADFSKYPNGLTWQPKWDVWSNLFEPLLAHVPLIHVNGNHEIEGEVNKTGQPNGIRMRSYNHRFPTPQTDERRRNGPTTFDPVTPSNKWENLYYAVEMTGVFKAIHLTSYSPGQPMNSREEQYVWLQAELAKAEDPWLMVNWHAPWYNTYATHFKENEAMRQAYEGLLLKYSVDVVFNGHVHAYERKTPIANNRVDRCGPVSITIGDGGNLEGTYRDFIDTVREKKAYCNPSSPNFGVTWNSYQPQNFSSLETNTAFCDPASTPCFCYGTQVPWSAYREPSFGYGILEFKSATEAVWTWNKNQESRFQIGDKVTIFRGGNDSPNCLLQG